MSGAYPIARFLTSLMKESGHSRSEFVRVLGYRNIERGRKRLDAWMAEEKGYSKIIKQIAARFSDDADELYAAISETKRIKIAETEAVFLAQCQAEQDTFVPHIVAIGEYNVPSNICIYGITGAKWDVIELPDNILALPLEKQLSALPDLMHSYRMQHQGQVPFFGPLTGFKYVRLLDHFQFDRNGAFIGQVDKPFRRGSCSVQIL